MQLDLTYLNEIGNNDRNFVLEILRMFMQQTSQDLDKLELIANQNDMQNLYSAVHKIKSSILMLGNETANEKIIKLENMIKLGESEDEIKAELKLFFGIASSLKAAVANELIKG
jgi:HPt (histidine-containing phosphotransfer) domain-containing protein